MKHKLLMAKHKLLIAALLAFALAEVAAQTSDDGTAPAEPAPEPPALQQSNGVKFLNGGASEEDRNRLRAQVADYPLSIALSGPGGEYIVADALKLSNRAGAEIATVPNAGPVVMFNLPPGQYVVEVSLPDGALARRAVRVGHQAQTLNWHLPQAPK
jgi:hypothetical protein